MHYSNSIYNTPREELSRFSESLTEADFMSAFANCAQQVGIDPNQSFILDGRSRYVTPLEKRHKSKVKVAGEWCRSKAGVRYPRITFFTFAGGTHSVKYNGYNDVIDLFERGHISTPVPSKPTPTTDPQPDYQRNRNKIITTWRNSYPLDHPKAASARAYLKHRGLGELVDRSDYPTALRCHPRLAYWDGSNGKPRMIGRFPTLIAAIQAPSSKTVRSCKTINYRN